MADKAVDALPSFVPHSPSETDLRTAGSADDARKPRSRVVFHEPSPPAVHLDDAAGARPQAGAPRVVPYSSTESVKSDATAAPAETDPRSPTADGPAPRREGSSPLLLRNTGPNAWSAIFTRHAPTPPGDQPQTLTKSETEVNNNFMLGAAPMPAMVRRSLALFDPLQSRSPPVVEGANATVAGSLLQRWFEAISSAAAVKSSPDTPLASDGEAPFSTFWTALNALPDSDARASAMLDKVSHAVVNTSKPGSNKAAPQKSQRVDGDSAERRVDAPTAASAGDDDDAPDVNPWKQAVGALLALLFESDTAERQQHSLAASSRRKKSAAVALAMATAGARRKSSVFPVGSVTSMEADGTDAAAAATGAGVVLPSNRSIRKRLSHAPPAAKPFDEQPPPATSGTYGPESHTRRADSVTSGSGGPSSETNLTVVIPTVEETHDSRITSPADEPMAIQSPRDTNTAVVVRDEDDDDIVAELNQYVLLESLGRGTQGEVYLAMDTAKNELRAVKAVPRPAQVAAGRPMNAAKRARWEALLREVGIMKRCRHRHVVSLYEVIDDPEQDTMYLVMQYVEHGPLATLLGDGRVSGTISAGTLATYGRQICAGLEYLHRHGVIHRDIKPENILVGQNEQVYLADFGMSEAFEGKGAEHRVTGTRGTAAFLAPELLREIVAQESAGSPVVVSDPTLVGSSGAAVDGKAVDVWALGITFYVLLYGHLPWAFEDARELFEAIQRHPIELRPIDPPLTASSSHFGMSAPPSVPVSLPHLFEGLPTTPTAATQAFKRRSFLSPSTASITPQAASAVDLTAPRGGGGVHGLLPIACLPGPEIDVRAATADLAQDVVSAEGESKGDGSSNGPSNESTEAPRLPRQSSSRRRRSCTSSSAPTATNSPRSMLDQQEASSPNMVMPMPHAAAAVTSGMLGTSVFLDSFIDDGTTAGLDTSWGSPSALQRSGLIASSVKSLVAEDARVVQHRVWHRESSVHSVWSSSVDEAWRRVLVGMLQRDPAQRLKIDAVRRQIAKIQELYVDQGRGGDPTTAAPDAVDANAVSTVLTAIRR